MTHSEEIKYWAKQPDHTKVWCKRYGEDWELSSTPGWIADRKYIVDNEWAELRKAQADGKQLQRRVPNHFGKTISERNEFTEWKDDVLDVFKPDYLDAQWRIKPEPVYEWQWIFQKYSGEWAMSSKFYTDNPKLGFGKCEKYEPSKRIRK